MNSPIAGIIADLGAKCDRRTKALLKAADALEEIRAILLKSKRKDDKQKLLFSICNGALEQIDLFVDEKIDDRQGRKG